MLPRSSSDVVELGEGAVESQETHERIHARPKHDRERQCLGPPESEAVPTQAVLGGARVATAQTKPRAELLDDRRGVVETAIGLRVKVDDLGGGDLAQHLLGSELLACRAQVVVAEPAGLVGETARPATLEVLGVERGSVRRRRTHERADARRLLVEAGAELDREPRSGGGDQDCLDERPEGEEQIATRRVAQRERSLGVEPQPDLRGGVVEQPRLRVVCGRRTEELPLEPPQLTEVAHVTSRR